MESCISRGRTPRIRLSTAARAHPAEDGWNSYCLHFCVLVQWLPGPPPPLSIHQTLLCIGSFRLRPRVVRECFRKAEVGAGAPMCSSPQCLHAALSFWLYVPTWRHMVTGSSFFLIVDKSNDCRAAPRMRCGRSIISLSYHGLLRQFGGRFL